MERIFQYSCLSGSKKYKSIRSLIFEFVSYKGQAKSVFAYYATPVSKAHFLRRKTMGIIISLWWTAFREWVVMWAKRGYAALALDTRGNGPDKKHIDGGFDENEKETPYFDVTLPQKKNKVGISGCQRYFQCVFLYF